MGSAWQSARGVVRRGHRVASGTGPDKRYPAGTLAMQRPFFAALGFDLAPFHDGTLNIDLAPHTFVLVQPRHTFRRVEWTHLHPPEDFSFSQCIVGFGGRDYAGWVYTPHPETKAAHFQPPTLMEILAPSIPGIAYGDCVDLRLPAGEILLR
jgi:hypothetical protein